MLILRLTVAGTTLFLAFYFFYDLIRSTFRGWLIGAVSLVLSATMLVGFLTPVVSTFIFAGGLLLLFLSPREIDSLLEIYLIVLSLMIILLGPGAYSMDARLFGRREIVLAKEK